MIMASDGPGSGGFVMLKWALSFLAAAIAIRIAISLLMSVMPELLALFVVTGLIYLIYRVQRYQRNRW